MFSKAKNKNGQDTSAELVEIGDTPERPKPSKPATKPQSTRMSGNNRKPNRPSGVPSLISGDVVIRGTIEADGEVQFDGALEGDIRAKGLVIGESATVKGEVVADKVKVAGTIDGAIRANQVELSASAHVKGDILHSALSIETGARFDGNCRHSEDPTTETLRVQPLAPKKATTTTASAEAPAPKIEEAEAQEEKITEDLKSAMKEAAPAAEKIAEDAKPVLKSIPNTGSSFLNRNGKAELR